MNPCQSCVYQDDCSQDKFNKDFDCKEFRFIDEVIEEQQ